MIYITGDKHADFHDIYEFCINNKTSKDDIIIILGDAGFNYYLDYRSDELKESFRNIDITLFCVHGNHEEYPANIKSYKTKVFNGGIVYYEDKYPNILFAKDSEIYNLDNKDVLVIGGAYSVDRDIRKLMGYIWYESEQITDDVKDIIREKLNKRLNKVDVILSHTCPLKYIPLEALKVEDQSKIDKSTEVFLDEIENNTQYDKWYCGHYHIDKNIDKIRFMMYDIDRFE